MVGLLQTAAWCRLHVDEDGTHILVGHQTRLGGFHHPAKDHDSHDDECTSQLLAVDESRYSTFVMTCQCRKAHVETFLELVQLRVAHDDGRQGRGERQGVEQRDGNGDGHRQSELRVERSCDATNEADGHEYRHEHQRGGDERRGNVVHGLGSHFFRISILTTLQSRLHRLYHHDGVVHHRTDNENQCEERQHVQREAYGVDDGQRGYQ